MSSRRWVYRVVKRQRGGDGKWFDYPTMATFVELDEAVEAARTFASQQSKAGVTATQIDIRSRRGQCAYGKGGFVATYSTEAGCEHDIPICRHPEYLYTTYGDIRGCCGHVHRTREAARACLHKDRRGCQKQGGYSDRGLRVIKSPNEIKNYDITLGPGTIVW